MFRTGSRFRQGGPDARLLAATLRPEAPAFAGVLALLLVVLGIRLALPLLLARFVDDAIGGAEVSDLVAIAVAYVVAALVAEGLQLLVLWFSTHLSWRSGNRLRGRLAAHASRLEMGWHGRHSPGELIERIDGDVEALVVFFANALVHVLGNVLLTVAMIVVAFTIDPWAGAVLAVTSVLGAVVMIRLRVAAVPAREAERAVNADLYGDLEERLGGLEDLRANGAGGYALHRLHSHSARSWSAARRASLLGEGSYSLAAIAFSLGSVATLALGFVLHDRGLVTVGEVLALYRYSELVRQPLELIAEQLKEFQKAIAGARRARRLLATTPVVVPGDRPAPDRAGGPFDVHFDAATLTYHRGGVPAVRSVDLRIRAGTTLGVVGRTGSGKTTLGRLVLRLWDVDDGAVRVGGIDVRDLSDPALRSTVAVVTQDVEVFRATVRDNLTLFDAHPTDDAALTAVLGRVGLGRWLRSLARGLDSPLDGDTSLSAGEAQLLAFARVLLADPAVVVLDEASSRLDAASEKLVAAATADLLRDRTGIVIAHRLATLDEVDAIAVMADGQLVEHGERAQLAADQSSRYARLRQADAATIDEALA